MAENLSEFYLTSHSRFWLIRQQNWLASATTALLLRSNCVGLCGALLGSASALLPTASAFSVVLTVSGSSSTLRGRQPSPSALAFLALRQGCVGPDWPSINSPGYCAASTSFSPPLCLYSRNIIAPQLHDLPIDFPPENFSPQKIDFLNLSVCVLQLTPSLPLYFSC